LPISIPLLKGLMGYRLLLINKGHQYKFSNISTLAQQALCTKCCWQIDLIIFPEG
jgi:hypothetical protein